MISEIKLSKDKTSKETRKYCKFAWKQLSRKNKQAIFLNECRRALQRLPHKGDKKHV